jgi:oligopeptide transport system permease protein
MMVGLVFSRFLRIIAILLGATLVAFLLMHAIPGNPWSNYASQQTILPYLYDNKALENKITFRFGLDLPLWRQYTRYVVGDFDPEGRFVCGAICGDLGPSIQQQGRPVQDILFKGSAGRGFWQSEFGYSVRLVFFSALVAVGLGIPLGMLSASKPRSKSARALTFGLAILTSIPNFVLGLLAILIFALWLKLITVLPDWDNWTH